MNQSQTSGSSSTKDLKQVLGRWDLFNMAIGQTIGAGVMSLTGVAIGITGRSVPIAYMIAAVFVIAMAASSVLIGGTIRLRGGWYTQVGLLLGKRFSGIFLMMFIFVNLGIAMYALSFADYFLGLVGLDPSLRKVVAIITLTVFYALNLIGVDAVAKIQNLIVVFMCAALAAFVAFGFFHIQPGYFDSEGFMTGGISGLLATGAILSFAAGGATQIVNISGEAKNPTKDMPFVIIASTAIVAVIYALVSFVAAGVLPLEQVANQPLTSVAEQVLPLPLYVFFMVGGAMFALISSLNAMLAWASKPLIQGCADGWLPKNFSALNRRKSPYKLLTIFYIIGLVPIITGLDIGTIADYTLILYNCTMILVCFSVVYMPKVIPDLWNKSPFHVSNGVLNFCAGIGVIAAIIQIFMLLNLFSMNHLYASITLMIICIVYALIREKFGNINLEISYDEK